MNRAKWIVVSFVTLLMAATACFAVDLDREMQFNIPAQNLDLALVEFSRQAKVQVITSGSELQNLRTEGATGRFTISRALLTLLRNSGLSFRAVGDSAVSIGRFNSAGHEIPASAPPAADGTTGHTHLAQARQGSQAGNPAGLGDRSDAGRTSERVELQEITVVPEILVVGSRILNMDIPRSRDGIQPYVIFDRDAIKNSGATNVEAFLKQRLPMNTQGATFSQGTSLEGNRSLVNLRGLGSQQTLILVDGRRLMNPAVQSFVQADLNGIPLAAIERIEVLPTTASGIYGGSATGGAINIILRRDYTGLEAKLGYENSFDAESAVRRVDLAAGFNLWDGKTSLLLAGSYSDAHALLFRDRVDLFQRSRERIANNNLASLLPPNVPPAGTTANIRSTDGSPLFGPGTESFTSVPIGYAGGGGLAPLQINAGRYDLGMDPSTAKQAVFNAPTLESINATVRHEVTRNLQVFMETNASNNVGHFPRAGINTFTLAANAPNNPFGKPVQVRTALPLFDGETYSESKDRRILGGAIVKLPKEWVAGLDYAWSRSTSRFSTPFVQAVPPETLAQINNGTIDILRDTDVYPLDLGNYSVPTQDLSPRKATAKHTTLVFSGPIRVLPAGALIISTKLEHRDEVLSSATQFTPNGNFLFPDRSQSVASAYMEINVPLFSELNSIRAVKGLDLQFAARWDDYTIRGASDAVTVGSPIVRSKNKNSSVNPTIGFRYQPIAGLALRASYGTGFLPPSLTQIVAGLPFVGNSTGSNLVDPLRGNTFVDSSLVTDSEFNSRLQPEESESWSAGVILNPHLLSGWRLSVDYTKIEKDANISTFPGSFQGIINSESLFQDRIVRGPNLPGDPPGWPGPITLIHGGFFNLARANVEAFDVQLDLSWETASSGTIDFFALATWQTHYETRVLVGQPTIENVGFSSSNPLKFKGNAGLSWRLGNWSLGWNANYYDSYLTYSPTASAATRAAQTLSQGNGGRVPDQIYHDVYARYGFQPNDSEHFVSDLLNGVEIQIGIRNIFNADPPVDVAALSASGSPIAGAYSPFGDPRLRAYNVSLKKVF